MFYVIRASNKYKQNYQVNLLFKISLHTKDLNLLTIIQDYFGVGNIIKHGPASMQYRISSIKDMSVLISHCNNFPLTSHKRIDLKLFKKAGDLIKAKLHLTD